MKKLLLSLLALLMLVGCSSKGTEANTSNTDSANTETQTVTEVQEIDVEALSAGEIYQAIIDNAEGLFVNYKMYDYDKEQEYISGVNNYIPQSKTVIGLALCEYQVNFPLGTLKEFYVDGGEDLSDELVKNLTTIMVAKSQEGQHENMKKYLNTIFTDLHERLNKDIEGFKVVEINKGVEAVELQIKDSAIVEKDNTIIACSGINCHDILSQSFNNVEKMFSER